MALIHGIVKMVKYLSQAHSISTDRASVVFLLGSLLQAPIVLPMIYLIYAHMRSLSMIMVPMTVQVLMTLAIFLLALKSLGK